MTLPWYPRDMGKYSRDTKHLSMLEHGAYNLLLDYYYSTGGLPHPSNATSNASLLLDHNRIYNICNARTKADQDAVDAVLSMFFYIDESGQYRNQKCDEVIGVQSVKHDKRVNAGRKGGNSKASSNATSNAPQKEKETKKENNKKEDHLNIPISNNIQGEEFAEFFKSYPKQTAMGSARASFTNAILLRGATAERIINAAKNYTVKCKSMDNDERKFIPNPSRWLDTECYNDPDLQVEAKPELTPESFTEDWQKQLSAKLGMAKFNAWFTRLVKKEENILVFGLRQSHDHVKNNYMYDLKDVGIQGIELRVDGFK